MSFGTKNLFIPGTKAAHAVGCQDFKTREEGSRQTPRGGGFEGVLNKPDTVLFIGIGCNIRVNWVQVSGLPLPNHMTLSK